MAETYLDVFWDVNPRTLHQASLRIAWWLIGRWLTVLDVILLLVVLYQLLSGASLTAIVVTAEGAFGGMVLLVLILFVAPRVRRNRALSEGRMHFIARDDGYVVEGPFGTQTFRWTTYKKAYADQRFIYMYLSNRMAQVIPLSVVPQPQPMLDHLQRLGTSATHPKVVFPVLAAERMI